MEVPFSGDEAFSEILGRYRDPIRRYVLTLVLQVTVNAKWNKTKPDGRETQDV